MEKLKALILKMKEEGAEEEAIVAAVANDAEVVAEIAPEGTEEEQAAVVAEEIAKALKAIRVSDSFKSKKVETENEAAAQKAMDARVEKALEGIKIEGVKSTKESREVKVFNHFTKKLEEKKEESDEMKAFAEMLGCLNTRKYDRADSICKEIAKQKETDYKAMGIEVKAPLYSDATTGSYLFPTEVEAQIFQRAYQSKMLQILNTQAITFEGKLYPVVTDFDLAFITDQTTQIGDVTPTIDNPSIVMSRIGGMTYSSNTLLAMKGSQLVDAFVVGFGNAIAKFVDLYSVASSVTGNTDGFNGILFDANTESITEKALAAIDAKDFLNLKNKLGVKFRAGAQYICNSEIYDEYGTLEDDAGNPIFKNFVDNGILKPYGKQVTENSYVPDTLDFSTAKRTTGTDNALICINGEGIVTGFDALRIDTSEHLKFDYDQTAWRGVARMGQKVISTSSTQGACAAYLKLTD